MRRGQSRFELVKKRLLSLHNRIGLKRTYQILFNTYALRISSIILLTRGRAVIKNPAEKGNFAAGHYGVPGAIRTRGLPLRRRMLYPTELRRRMTLPGAVRRTTRGSFLLYPFLPCLSTQAGKTGARRASEVGAVRPAGTGSVKKTKLFWRKNRIFFD